MTQPEDLGVVQAIAGPFMQTLGANIPVAVNYFSGDAMVTWDNQKATGKAKILELFKSLPIFKSTISTCDCQEVAARPGNVIVVLTGILVISGETKRFHSSFFVEQFRLTSSALIKSMVFTFCPDPLPNM